MKDDFGVLIMYECALQDLNVLETDLLKIGSFYINKHESLIDTEADKPYPLVDRLSLLEDLLGWEQ